jgi:hypothetical protein
MSAQVHMKVRYNPVVGVGFLVLGAAVLFLGLWVTSLGEFSPGVIGGPVLILLSVPYLARPYFHVTPTAVVLKAGLVKREFPYQTLEVEDGKLVAVAVDGTRSKVPVARWLARAADWAVVTRR